MKKILNLIVYLGSVSAVFSANIATDNAADSVYSTANGGWTSGDNGGSGFGAWTITSSPNGGFSGSFIGNSPAGTTDLDFGIYSGGNANASLLAYRPFTGGGMTAGQRFTVDLAHTATINGQIGLSLMDGTNARWTLKFVGGGTGWTINDGGGGGDFGAGQSYIANNNLTLTFTYNGGNSYSYIFGTGSGINFTAAANLSNLDGVQFFSTNQGADQNLTFNNLAIPEPSSASLMALGTAGLLALRRRRNA